VREEVTRRSRALALALALVTVASCSTYRLGDRQLADARTDPRGSSATSTVSTLPAPASGSADPASGGTGASAGTAASGGRAPAANVASPAGARTASDRGVTPDAIKLGIMTPAEDTLASIGATYKGKSAEQVSKPFIDEINAQGGINGRKLVPAFTRYNPASADDMVAACIDQSEDEKVFATLALIGFYGEGEVCLANKETPTLSSTGSSEYTLYQREKGWVRQTQMNKDRTLRNWIDWMAASGTATPATRIGLVYTDVPEDRQVVQDVVLPYLRSKGLSVKDVAVFTLSSIDAMVGEAQRAAFKFKADGIELVLPVTNFLQFFLFVQQADLTGYVPRYTVTDFGGMSTATDFYPATQWTGVTGTTSTLSGQPLRGGVPDTPAAQDCLRAYNAAGQHFGPDPDHPELPDPVEVTTMLYVCEHVALFADAARRAGVNPTRRSFLDAVGNTGAWSYRVALTPPLLFTPKRYDSVDNYAVVRWQPNCNGVNGCYRRIEGFRPGQ
jgi:ABC-type branched-subunit amino acid transport system substrate-binding protein